MHCAWQHCACVLDFHSGHSKVVKNAVTTSMRAALKKSCLHWMKESIEMPLDGLKLSWFSEVYLARLTKRILQVLSMVGA